MAGRALRRLKNGGACKFSAIIPLLDFLNGKGIK